MEQDRNDPIDSLQSAKRLALGLAVALVAIAAVRFAGTLLPGPPRDADKDDPQAIEPAESGSPITLVRQMPEAEDLEAEAAWVPGATVVEATKRLNDQPGWRSEWRGEGEMAFLESLGGVPNQGAEGLNWQFEVNGEYATRGAGAVTLAPGDRVLWKLAPYE